MTWQVFLSSWMVMQCIRELGFLPIVKADMIEAGEDPDRAQISLFMTGAGTISRYVCMFVCLYLGGYYNIYFQ